MFSNETPGNITEIPVDEVWKMVKDPKGYSGPSPRVRLNYVKMLYDVLGLELTSDAALATIAMHQSTLILAIAGGGKTTLVHVKALLFKLILSSKFRKGKKMSGKEILYLVYNRHNVPDAEKKHEQMVHRLMAAGIKGLEIDSDLHVRTMHSFCEFWRKQYAARLGLVGFTAFRDENESLAAMTRAIRIAYKMLQEHESPVATAKNLLALYTYSKESMKDINELQYTDKFIEIGLPVYVVEKCFERYEASKALKRKYDYCDILTKVCDLLENDEKVLTQIQTYYSTIFADEVQDFTPVMWKILRLLTNNGTYLNCIGDEDQNLYNFRGADIYELLNFKQNFADSSVYTLVHNRRCCDVILNEARDVISQNTLRFEKKIVGLKSGGVLEFKPYNTIEGQIYSVVETLSKLSQDEQWNSVICFREHACSRLLIDCLEERKMRFNSLQGVLPFSHEIYRHLISILNALEAPYNRDASLNLYKVLPCSKAQLAEVMGYDVTKGKFCKEVERRHFAEYDYGKLLEIRGMLDTLKELIEISRMIATEPMSMYFDRIFELFYRYFWDFMKQQHDDIACDDIFEERAKKFFRSDKTFSEFFDAYTKRISTCRRNNEVKAGITVSTFHGLKGLEFDRVYAIFLNEDIFPNFSLIDSKEYPDEVKKELRESETRLWYVTLTRAKEYFCGYYFKAHPSCYVLDHFDREKGVYSRLAKVQEDIAFEDFSNEDFSDEDFSDEDFSDEEVLDSSAPDLILQEIPEKESFREESDLVQGNPRLAKVQGDYLSRLLSSLGKG